MATSTICSKAYADYLGVRLRIVDGDRRGGRMAPEQDAADIVTTLATRVYDDLGR